MKEMVRMCLKFPYCHLKDCLMIQCDHPSDDIAHILVLPTALLYL